MDEIIGKVLKNEKDEEYVVLEYLEYKDIPCVYAMKVCDNKEAQKTFLELDKKDKLSLISINSKKMLTGLTNKMFKDSKDNNPRKINEDESIAEYLNYLDEFYKSHSVTVL